MNNAPENISFSFGPGSIKNDSVNDTFLKTAINPVFPFLRVKLKLDESNEGDEIEIKVSKKIYEIIKSAFFTDELLFYFQGSRPLGQWSYDMVLAINVCSKLNLMNTSQQWINNSRISLEKLISNEKISHGETKPELISICEELLKSFQIFEKVKTTDILFAAAKEALNEKQMDSDTMIYRLGMAIYHSNKDNISSIISDLDDPSSLYLRLTKSPLNEKYKEQFKEIMELPFELKLNAIKILVAFIIGAYGYYFTLNELGDEK